MRIETMKQDWERLKELAQQDETKEQKVSFGAEATSEWSVNFNLHVHVWIQRG